MTTFVDISSFYSYAGIVPGSFKFEHGYAFDEISGMAFSYADSVEKIPNCGESPTLYVIDENIVAVVFNKTF